MIDSVSNNNKLLFKEFILKLITENNKIIFFFKPEYYFIFNLKAMINDFIENWQFGLL